MARCCLLVIFNAFALLHAGESSCNSNICLQLAANPNPAKPGGLITYTVTVVNNGTNKINYLIFNFPVPDYTQIHINGTTDFSCSGKATCTPGYSVNRNLGSDPLLPGQSRTEVIAAQVNSGANAPGNGTLILAQVNLQFNTYNSGGTLTGQSGASASAEVAVDATPGLTLGLAAVNYRAEAGQSLDYILTFGNSSGVAISNATLRATLPPGTSLVSAVDGVVVGDQIEWPLASIGAGDSGKRSFKVQVDAGAPDGKLLLNHAELIAPGLRSAAAESSAVVSSDGVDLSVTAASDPVKPGGLITYTVTVVNNGANKINYLIFNLPVPDYTQININGTTDFSCSGKATCTPGYSVYRNLGSDPLLPGQSRTEVIAAQVNSGANAPGNGTLIAAQVNLQFNTYNSAATHIGQSGASVTSNVRVKGGLIVTAPFLSLVPSVLNFSNQEIGSQNDLPVTVKNLGNANLSLGILSTTGTNASDFLLTFNNCDNATLAPSVSCEFNVGFLPKNLGVRSANVSISSNSPGSPHVVALSGNGIQPTGAVLAVTPSGPISFGSINLSANSLAKVITLKNSGVANLSLGKLALTGTHPGDFLIINNNCNNQILVPNGSCTMALSFNPKFTGNRIASILVPNNAPGNPLSIVLTGTGISPVQTIYNGTSSNAMPAKEVAEPVNAATGNYYYQHTDLALQGPGLPLAFTRTYNAQDGRIGLFGKGWTTNYSLLLTTQSDGTIIVSRENGRDEVYEASEVAGIYKSRFPGIHDVLVKNADNSYTLTSKDKIQINFGAGGKLANIVDRNGNTLTFGYDNGGKLSAITNTVGRTISLVYDTNNRLIKLTDPLNRSVQYSYDVNNNLVSDTDPMGGVTGYSYNANGVLTKIIDRRGNTLIENTYDNLNRVVTQKNGKGFVTYFAYDTPNDGDTKVTDPLGHNSIYTHDSWKRLIMETDPLGYKVQYVYDTNNNRTQIIDKNGQTTAFTYDGQGNVLTKTDAQGKVTTLEYNSLNDPTRIVDALGHVTTFAYDAKGNLSEVADALGQKTKVAYDASGQPASITDARGGVMRNTFNAQGNLIQVEDALGHKTTLTYDAIGRRTGMTDANNHTASFTYDNNGNLVSVTDPLGHKTTFSFDANNNRTGVTDPRGNATAFVYDANDLLSKATDPLGNFVQFAYDAADNRIKVTDPRGNITQYAYDAANRLTQVTDALNHATTLAYDANGNLLTQTNPLGHTSSFAYDELNRLLNATDALGNKGFRSYDALGRLTQAKDAKGRITQYAYDALGRLTKVTDAKGGTAVYDYDALGNRIAVTDPNGHKTGYSYDALNRLSTKTDPLGQAYSYSYDPVGNRISLTDAKGQNLLYSYDGNNRLAAIDYPDNTQVTFGYDAAGNRTRMIDKLGTSTYVFDALNRLDEYTDAFGKTVANEYDKAGNRIALIYPDGKRVTYAYDALNRMASVTDWLNGVTNYSYDVAGKLAEVLNPNGTKVSYGYDAAERLVNLANAKADTSVLASYALTLDAVGNRSGINRSEPLAPVFTNKTQALTFDNDNRLLTLDAASVTHDPNGNLTAEPGKSFNYDFEDRLIAATGDQIVQFSYDGVGNRMAATRNGQTTRYTLDISGAMSNVLVENDVAGNPTAYYVHGLGLTSRITPNGDARYYHYDTIGSTVALTDAAGNVTDSYAYDPFGQVLNAQGTVNNPFRYVGQFGVMQEGNGLQFMRARYYEAGIGRFLNKDPLMGSSLNAQTQNRFAYGLNNPIRFVDYSGFSAKEKVSNNDSIVDWLKYLHYEKRDTLNGEPPPYENITDAGWIKLDTSQSVLHDNGDEYPEEKYIHPDGREVVYEGKSKEPILDCEFKGTYNYVNPEPVVSAPTSMGEFKDGLKQLFSVYSFRYTVKNAGHIIVDVAPWRVGQNCSADSS